MSQLDPAGVPHRLDEDTRALGLSRLAAVRGQLAAPAWRRREQGRSSPIVAPVDDVAEMVAEMAAGAERELLERRVLALEAEVARLRAALAGVIGNAAAALGPDSDDVNLRQQQQPET
jgi:hypothetical protein